MSLLTQQAETRIVRRSVHNERESNRLPSLAAVISTHADIVMRVGFAALVDLMQNRRWILFIKHWQSPHLPIGVARMGIIGELYIDGPVVVQTVLHLLTNLVVGQRWQEGNRSLRKMKSHIRNSFSLH